MFTPAAHITDRFTHENNISQTCSTNDPKQAHPHTHIGKLESDYIVNSVVYVSSSHSSENVSIQLETHTTVNYQEQLQWDD